MTNRPLVTIIDDDVMKQRRPPRLRGQRGAAHTTPDLGACRSALAGGQALRNDLNAARSSLAKTCGCSQAAK